MKNFLLHNRKRFFISMLVVFVLLSSTIHAGIPEVPKISAESAAVMDMQSSRLLYSKNAHVRRPIASTTKIMTAIVALENGNLDDEVEISGRAAQTGGSGINLKAGEKHSLRVLLYGLLVRSGNDAAVAIAEHIGGSVEGFADMMNEKARLLGAGNSRFVTPHGLDRSGQYSTAYDLALITRYALNNMVFADIVSTKQIKLGSREWFNTNEMLRLYPGADGVKTGYTGKAGRCLVTSATRSGMKLISVVLYCGNKTQRTISSKKILDYVFDNYRVYKIADRGHAVADLPVARGKVAYVKAVTDECIRLPLTLEEYKQMETVCHMPGRIEAPVYGGMDVGTLSVVLDEKVIAQSKLKASVNVIRKRYHDYLLDVLKSWLGIFGTITRAAVKQTSEGRSEKTDITETKCLTSLNV